MILLSKKINRITLLILSIFYLNNAEIQAIYGQDVEEVTAHEY